MVDKRWEKFSNNDEVKEVLQSLKKVACSAWRLRLSSRGPDNQPLLSAVDSAKVSGFKIRGLAKSILHDLTLLIPVFPQLYRSKSFFFLGESSR